MNSKKYTGHQDSRRARQRLTSRSQHAGEHSHSVPVQYRHGVGNLSKKNNHLPDKEDVKEEGGSVGPIMVTMIVVASGSSVPCSLLTH